MWFVVCMLSTVIWGLTSLTLVYGKASDTGYGNSGDMKCGEGQVFAITRFNDTTGKLAMICATPQICGKPGAMIRKNQNCQRDGEFMARADELRRQSGNVRESCNGYKLPPKDDYDQICVTLIVDDGEKGGNRRRRSVLGGRARFENNLAKEMFINAHQRIKRQGRAVDEDRADIFVLKTIINPIQLSWYIKDIARKITNYEVVGCLVVCRDERDDPTNPENSDFYDQYRSDGLRSGASGESSSGVGSSGGDITGGDVACFSADSTVESMSGSIRMDQVKTGDKIMAYNAKLSIYVFDQVLYFIHREPAAISDFVVITTEGGKTLTLTAKHLIPVGDCDRSFEDSPEKARQLHMEYMKPADQAQVGQCVMVKNDDDIPALDKIVGLGWKSRTGIFAPVTKEGNVIVNGVHASCYSEFGDYATLSGIFGVYHSFLDVVGGLVGTISGATRLSPAPNVVQLPQVTRFLIEAGKLLK